MRANNTERIGVYATGYIFSSEIDWVFREQKEVDVGIDALIEESIDSNPTGKFLAAQIKTGLGNFSESSDKLTYYISNVHYYYWMNLSLPIILIAHLPNTKKTLWEFITEKTVRPTKKKWKIEIQKIKILNSNSKPELTRIINGDYDTIYYEETTKGEISDSELKKLLEGIISIQGSEKSLFKLTSIIEDLGTVTRENTNKVNEYVSLGYSDQDKKVKSLIKKYSQNLTSFSKKLDKEILVFAEKFSDGIQSYEKLAHIYFEHTKDYKELRKTYEVIMQLEPAIDEALEGLIIMRDEISGLPRKYSHLKKARLSLLESTEQIIQEMNISKLMSYEFSQKLDKVLN